jgi:hypothetical protein
MRLDDCYELLEVQPGASPDELKRAHRDLTKVWHPDRFANDAALRQKAQEKLKAINEAYETILASSPGTRSGSRPPRPPQQAAPSRRMEAMRSRLWAVTCASLAVFIILRRPTPGGLILGVLLFCAAYAFIVRMREYQ